MGLIRLTIILLCCCSAIHGQENKTIKEGIKATVKVKTRNKAEVENAVKTLENRITYCSKYAQLTYDSLNQEIKIAIAGKKDTTLYKNLILSKGHLKILETYRNTKVLNKFEEINHLLRDNDHYGLNFNLNEDTLSQEIIEFRRKNPLYSVMRPAVDKKGMPAKGALIGYSKVYDTSTVNQIFRLKEVKQLFPENFTVRWQHAVNNIYQLIAIKEPDNYQAMTTAMIDSVFSEKNSSDSFYNINIHFKKAHHDQWAKLTKQNIGNSLAILIDGQVYTVPDVNSEINEGKSLITGKFDINEARILAAILKYGPIDANLVLKDIKMVKSP